MAENFGNVLTSGIQDISALLPLLGTEQCERHVASSLTGGFLYAAAAPLSIFGSLGIAKAGLYAFFSSFTGSSGFNGGRFLKDAGFEPTGTVLPLVSLDEKGQLYTAEKRLTELLRNLHINDPEKVTIRMKSTAWNISLLLIAPISVVLALTPYVYPYIRGHSQLAGTAPGLLFPIIRACGSVFISIAVQFLLQSKILHLLRRRLLFLAVAKQMKSMGFTPPEYVGWNDHESTDMCLMRLMHYLRNRRSRNDCYFFGRAFRRSRTRIDQNYDFTETTESRYSTNTKESLETVIMDDEYARNRIISDRNTRRRIAHMVHELEDCINNRVSNIFPLALSRLLILLGVPMSIAGYIGCFNIISGGNVSVAAPLWLAIEAVLSILRIFIWAWNPSQDEDTALIFTLSLDDQAPLPTSDIIYENLKHTSPLPLVPERDFIESVTAYTGPLHRFQRNDVSLYFAYIGSLILDCKILFITFSSSKDLGPGRAMTFEKRPVGDDGEEFIFYNVELEIDAETGHVQAVLRGAVPLMHRFNLDQELMEELMSYYQYISDSIHKQAYRRSILPDSENYRFSRSWSLSSETDNFDGELAAHQRKKLATPRPTLSSLEREYLQNDAKEGILKSEQDNVSQATWKSQYMLLLTNETFTRLHIQRTGARANSALLLEESSEMEFILLDEIYIVETVLMMEHQARFLLSSHVVRFLAAEWARGVHTRISKYVLEMIGRIDKELEEIIKRLRILLSASERTSVLSAELKLRGMHSHIRDALMADFNEIRSELLTYPRFELNIAEKANEVIMERWKDMLRRRKERQSREGLYKDIWAEKNMMEDRMYAERVDMRARVWVRLLKDEKPPEFKDISKGNSYNQRLPGLSNVQRDWQNMDTDVAARIELSPALFHRLLEQQIPCLRFQPSKSLSIPQRTWLLSRNRFIVVCDMHGSGQSTLHAVSRSATWLSVLSFPKKAYTDHDTLINSKILAVSPSESLLVKQCKGHQQEWTSWALRQTGVQTVIYFQGGRVLDKYLKRVQLGPGDRCVVLLVDAQAESRGGATMNLRIQFEGSGRLEELRFFVDDTLLLPQSMSVNSEFVDAIFGMEAGQKKKISFQLGNTNAAPVLVGIPITQFNFIPPKEEKKPDHGNERSRGEYMNIFRRGRNAGRTQVDTPEV